MMRARAFSTAFDGACRRRGRRQFACKPGEVRLSTGETLACVVVDHDEFGARVRFAKPVSLPKEFRLRSRVLRIDKQVRTVWRAGGEMGLEAIG